MKKELLGGVAAIALIAAAGVSVPAAAQEPFDWTGFYLGAHIGTGEPDYEGGLDLLDSPDDVFFADDLDLSGVAGGFQGGYNYQIGQVVLGVEADVTFVDWQDTIVVSATSGDLTIGISGDVDLLWSVRARLGFAVDRALVYATGGVAFSDADWAVNGEDGSGSVDFDDVGGVVGGGVELAVKDWLTFRLEGLYYIFDDRIDTAGIVDPESLDTGDFAEFDDAYVIRVGVSFRF